MRTPMHDPALVGAHYAFLDRSREQRRLELTGPFAEHTGGAYLLTNATMMTINWNFPPPRRGLAGALDRFIGPGATPAELTLQFGLPTLAAVAAPLHAAHVVEHWSWLQYAACCILAFDTAGGVITNATSTAKRWYHRSGQGFKQHLGMVSLHLIHLFVVAWLYLSFDLAWFATASAYLLISASIVLAVPKYLQRPVAVTAYACALLLLLYVLRQPAGLEWFLPLFYLKLLVSHLPMEEPFRPTSEADKARPKAGSTDRGES